MDLTSAIIAVFSVFAFLSLFLIFVLWKKNQRLSREMHVMQINQREREHAISIVSHDLKGPLNRIYALINLLELSGMSSTDQGAEYLDKMNQVVKEGMMLIKNILDLQKMERGETSLNLEKTDVGTLLRRLASEYMQHGKYKGVEFHLRIEGDIQIITDKIYLTRMLDNLVSNALKFSIVGGKVLIDAREEKDKYIVSIRNQGEQITSEEAGLLFTKYTQLSVKPTMGESSTGIGLAIVRLISEELGYNVFYEPWADLGSTFVVEIPYGSR